MPVSELEYTLITAKSGRQNVRQDFDFIYETDRTTICGQVKCPSLSDYDHDGLDGEDATERLYLERWGDLHTPFRLNRS